MNQILSTSMPMDDKKNSKKVKSNKPIAIGSILKFFAMIMLIFGIFVVGNGTYAIYKNQLQIAEENLKPTISIEYKTDRIVLLKVIHQRNISKVEYAWNEEETIIVNGNNGKYLEKEITLPVGKNTLHVLVQDENGKEMTYDKEYEVESDINLSVSENKNKIKISYESDVVIAYLTYKWDDGEESTIEVNNTIIDEEIDVLKGLHELTVTVVDEYNNTDTKVQKISGVSKPKVKIDYDSEVEHFVVKASDDEQLTKIELKLNQEEPIYVLNLQDMDLKELEYTVPIDMQIGENILEVTVYNKNGLSEYSGAKVVKRD